MMTMTMTMTPSRYLDVPGAAAYLGRSERAVYNLVFRRTIPFIRQGRRLAFDRQVLDQWMKTGEVIGPPPRRRRHAA